MQVTQLPIEIQKHIFFFLDVQSLVKTSAVCKQWNICITTDNLLWQTLFFERYGYTMPKNPTYSSRQIYIQYRLDSAKRTSLVSACALYHQ